MYRSRSQQCRLILSKRQIKGRGFQKCDRNFFRAHWYAFKLLTNTTLRNFQDGGSIKDQACNCLAGYICNFYIDAEAVLAIDFFISSSICFYFDKFCTNTSLLLSNQVFCIMHDSRGVILGECLK